eukprot:scaffold6322_cov59-Cylindrotheca_fusiformis.AAC.21
MIGCDGIPTPLQCLMVEQKHFAGDRDVSESFSARSIPNSDDLDINDLEKIAIAKGIVGVSASAGGTFLNRPVQDPYRTVMVLTSRIS